MFKSQEGFTNSMFGSYAYEPIIKRNKDHLLVRLSENINWSFVEEELSDYYSAKGQNAIHPERLFKLLIMQKLYDLSEREIMVNTDCNIIYRYFAGYGLTEEMPHWTELGKFKERIGEDAFEKLFYRVLEEAQRLGIEISNKRIADATDMQANVDLKRCAKDKRDDDDNSFIDRNTSDPDAKFGRKSTKKNGWYGYKSHMNEDSLTELVTAVNTTDASETDESQLIPLIDKEQKHRGKDSIRKQGGDKGYIGHTQEMQERGILDYVIPRDNMKKDKARKESNNHYLHIKRKRYKVEQKFSEGKGRHGLGQARHRGRWRVHIQCLITYLAMNLKRIANLLFPKTA